MTQYVQEQATRLHPDDMMLAAHTMLKLTCFALNPRTVGVKPFKHVREKSCNGFAKVIVDVFFDKH